MNLRTKAVVGFSVFITAACILIGVLGYKSANDGFAQSLQMKAESNVTSGIKLFEYRYPGAWHIEDGKLYKGSEPIDGNNNVADSLGTIFKGHVTIFRGDTRVATTVKNPDGSRAVGSKASDKIIDAVLNKGNDYTGVAEVIGEEYHCAYEPLKDDNDKIVGMLFVGLSVHQLDDVHMSLLRNIIVTIAAVLLVIGVLAWFVIGKAMKPLEEVAANLLKISAGDLKIPDLAIKTDDEIGVLAKGANEMKHALRKLLQDVHDSVETVASSSEELNANATQTAESIRQVADSAVHMSEGTAEQVETVDALMERVEEMRRHMQELHDSAVAMEDVAEQSREKVVSGRKTVNHAIEQIGSIAEQVNTSAEVVDNLGNRSKEIGTIVETIQGIAEQTNLLALNAAIEAARAGEAGRGFAVVAEEVRKLAEQSATAAGSISSLIGTIQSETDYAVKSIAAGNKSVHEGSNSVTATGDAFSGIEDQVNRLNENVRRSISFIDEVNKASMEIINAMANVQTLSQKSTDEAQNVSAATEEQAATMQEMADSGQKLSDLAQNLQNEISKFRI